MRVGGRRQRGQPLRAVQRQPSLQASALCLETVLPLVFPRRDDAYLVQGLHREPRGRFVKAADREPPHLPHHAGRKGQGVHAGVGEHLGEQHVALGQA